MDPQGVLCVRVPEGDPDYAPDILEKPECCAASKDTPDTPLNTTRAPKTF